MQEVESPIPLTADEQAMVAIVATAQGYDNPEDYMRAAIENGIAELSSALVKLNNRIAATDARLLH